MAGVIFNTPQNSSDFFSLVLQTQAATSISLAPYDDQYSIGWDNYYIGSFDGGPRLLKLTLTAGNTYDFYVYNYVEPGLSIYDAQGNWYAFSTETNYSIDREGIDNFTPTTTQDYYFYVYEMASYYEYLSFSVYEDVASFNNASQGDDVMTGTFAAETMDGLGGNDVMYGGGNSDTLSGSAGNDTMYGGTGIVDPNDTQDYLYGGSGSDEIYGNGGNDIIYGGDQNGNVGDTGDLIYAGYGMDFIFGGEGNDSLYGGGSRVDPADLGDIIAGEAGDDYIIANGGDDTINGGAGNDTMHGGIGNDTYVFKYGEGIDSILYFQGAGEEGGDVLQFTRGGGINSVEDLLSKMVFSEADRTVTFTFDSNNAIIISDISAALTSGDIVMI